MKKCSLGGTDIIFYIYYLHAFRNFWIYVKIMRVQILLVFSRKVKVLFEICVKAVSSRNVLFNFRINKI